MQSHDHDAHERKAVERPRTPAQRWSVAPARPRAHGPADEAPGHCGGFSVPLTAFGVVEARAGSPPPTRPGRQTDALAAAPAVVEAVVARPAAAGRSLTLPGETHAWYERHYLPLNGEFFLCSQQAIRPRVHWAGTKHPIVSEGRYQADPGWVFRACDTPPHAWHKKPGRR